VSYYDHFDEEQAQQADRHNDATVGVHDELQATDRTL